MLEPDRDQWLTYAEVGERFGITPAAARMLVKRRGWPRRTPNACGDRARVLVPPDAVAEPRSRPGLNGGSYGEHTAIARIHVLTIIKNTIEEVVQPITKLLDHERERAERAERRIDELQAELTAERRRLIEILSARRPWWRRIFR